MSDNKKYYYLKLKETFYDSEDLKIIEGMENGFIYSNLYLKMILLSLKDEGRLLFKGRIPYNEEMLATITSIPLDNVRCGIKILAEYGMIDILESGVMYMTDIQDLIGTGSTEAERKAKYRKRINEEKGIVPHKKKDGTMSGTNCGRSSLELEKELEKELDINKEQEKKQTVYTHNSLLDLFETWKESGLTEHSLPVLERSLKKKHVDILKAIDFEEAKKSVINYAKVKNGDQYYFSYSWTFWDFICRGLYKFMDENKPLECFKKQKSFKEQQKEDEETARNLEIERLRKTMI